MFGRDFGSKIGSGGVASAELTGIQRRERLRQLALETSDIASDPYLLRNHLGSFECKLCLTLHTNEGSYLAHTQGKRHQQNLARRAAKLAKDTPGSLLAVQKSARTAKDAVVPALRQGPSIGTPGYKVIKLFDPSEKQYALLFRLHLPQIQPDLQPRHRFMSAVEQRIEQPNLNYQYVLFAAAPYDTIGFKVPNLPVDKREGKFLTDWNASTHTFTLQLHFAPPSKLVSSNDVDGDATDVLQE